MRRRPKCKSAQRLEMLIRRAHLEYRGVLPRRNFTLRLNIVCFLNPPIILKITNISSLY